MGAVFEQRFIDSFQNHTYNFLYEFIVGGWEAQRSLFLGNFGGYMDSSYWFRLVSPFSDDFDEISSPLWRVTIKGFCRCTSCEGSFVSLAVDVLIHTYICIVHES